MYKILHFGKHKTIIIIVRLFIEIKFRFNELFYLSSVYVLDYVMFFRPESISNEARLGFSARNT